MKNMNTMHTLTTLSISSLSLFIVRIAMMPSPAAAATADSLEPTDYKMPLTINNNMQIWHKKLVLTNIL